MKAVRGETKAFVYGTQRPADGNESRAEADETLFRADVIVTASNNFVEIF